MTGSEDLINDPRSNHDIISSLVRAADNCDDKGVEFFQTVAVLHARGGYDIFLFAISLCRDITPARRKLGAMILGELGCPERSFPEKSAHELLRLVREDSDVSVVASAIFALGHLGYLGRKGHPVDDLGRLKNSPDEDTRHAVAFALASTQLHEAVETLVELMDDDYVLARDWATTGIAAMTSEDGPKIRDALIRKCSDIDSIIRAR